MPRQLILGLVLVGLLLQGAAAASVEGLQEEVTQSHCAGAGLTLADGNCCPDEAGMSVGCMALCQAGEAPSALDLPAKTTEPVVYMAAAEIAGPSRSYVPDLPPPIA